MIFIAVQNTYHHCEVAVFQDLNCLSVYSTPNREMSRQFIPLLSTIFADHKITMSDISFFAVNTGPGPYTTVRTTLSFLNGIAFSTEIPLVSIDGLELLVKEHQNSEFPITIGLLQAFNNDIYFAILKKDEPLKTGCTKIDSFLASLPPLIKSQNALCIGNGAELYRDQFLSKKEISNIKIPQNIPPTCTIQAVGMRGYELFHAGITTTELQIGYLKNLSICG